MLQNSTDRAVFVLTAFQIGPIIAGPMAEYAGSNNTGWRNFWWLNVGLIGAAFVMCLFGFPETKWHRMHPDEIRRLESEAAMKSSDEKIAVQTTEGSGIEKSNSTGLPNLSHATTTQKDPWLGKGRPSKQQFKLFQANAHPFQSILLDLWIPWKLFAFPIVEFASFVVSWSASCFLTDNLLQSQAFAAPPYLFSPLKIGFFNFAVLVGAVIGSVTAGPLSDWISMKLTKRNNGIREPEMRLPTMIPYFILMLIGNFVTAFGWENHSNWKVSLAHFQLPSSSPPIRLKILTSDIQVIVIVGWACTGIQVAALPAIASTYAIDSYKPVAGSIFVSITVNKNLWGYGFSKFINAWAEKSGYVPPIMTNMSLTALWCLSGIIFWFRGKRFRTWTKNSLVHHM